MSFSSGTADSRENLLDLFRAFAFTSGWTINRFAASGTGYVLNMQKTGKYAEVLYANLRSCNNENLPGAMPTITGVVLSMSDAYNAANDCVDQPGSPVSSTNATNFYCTAIAPFTAVSKYWFFSDTDPEFLAMVVLLPNGQFRHLTIGQVEKTDTTLVGSAFMFGTNGMSDALITALPFETADNSTAFTGNSWLRLNADERNGWWTHGRKPDGLSAYTPIGCAVGAKFRDGLLLYNSLNIFSNSASLCPINIFARNQLGKFFPVGYVPSWRIARRQAFIVDVEYTLGADVWMAFPASTNTGDYSLVYHKVV